MVARYLTCDAFSVHSDHHASGDAVHSVRIASLADTCRHTHTFIYIYLDLEQRIGVVSVRYIPAS